MRALVQRVLNASVTVDGEVVGALDGPGLCVLIGVTHSDTVELADKLADKTFNLRCFEDADGVMNLPVSDVGGKVLVVSQFTLYGDTRKGRRPSWVEAAQPDVAEPLIQRYCAQLETLGAQVQTGRFRADMKVALTNDGPVTLMLEV